MTAIEVWLNGNRICTAGDSKAESLQASLFAIPSHDYRHFSVHVKSRADAKLVRDLRWAERQLQPGDELRIVLKETATVDAPETERAFGSSLHPLPKEAHSCSFCGLSQDQVKRLTLGFGGNICGDCAKLASDDAV